MGLPLNILIMKHRNPGIRQFEIIGGVETLNNRLHDCIKFAILSSGVPINAGNHLRKCNNYHQRLQLI